MSDVLYFLHIPKTAGTSLNAYLDSKFEESEILPYKLWHKYLDALSEGSLKDSTKPMDSYKFIRGHFGYDLSSEMSAKPKYLTFLREPIERCISNYHHQVVTIQRQKDKGIYTPPVFFEGEGDDLEDILSDDRGLRFSNIQSKFIAIDVDPREKYKTSDNKNEVSHLPSYEEFLHAEKSDEQLADLANKRLSNFDFIGITEYFNESLILLADHKNWTLQLPDVLMTFKNRPQREDLSDVVNKKLEELNKADAKVYSDQKKQFEDRWVEYISEKLEIDIIDEYLDKRDRNVKKLIEMLNKENS